MAHPVYCHELPNSRSYIDGKDTLQGTMEYVLKGTNDELIARTTFKSKSPTTFPNVPKLVRGDINVRALGGLMWFATVTYIPDYAPIFPAVGVVGTPLPVPAAPGLNTPLGADFAFDLSAQTEHITQSKGTASRTGRKNYPQPGTNYTAPDHKGAIGVSDGEIKGCDIFKPYLEWSRSVTFVSITQSYIDDLESLVGKVNNKTFYGANEGTTMFLGASGNIKDALKAVVTFKFARARHRTNIPIIGTAPDGDLIIASKRAWDYLWIAYKNVEDAGQLTQQPVAGYVEKVIDAGDFDKLRIGGS